MFMCECVCVFKYTTLFHQIQNAPHRAVVFFIRLEEGKQTSILCTIHGLCGKTFIKFHRLYFVNGFTRFLFISLVVHNLSLVAQISLYEILIYIDLAMRVLQLKWYSIH